MENRIIDLISQALFQMKWLFMSPHRRYVYLWQRTKTSHYK